METQDMRLKELENSLSTKEKICTSKGTLNSFPSLLFLPYMVNGVGVVVCSSGEFSFSLENRTFSAKAGETLFLPEDSTFQVLKASDDLEYNIFLYQIEPIRDILGNMVIAMHLYSQLAPEPSYVWNTGEEDEVLHYMQLLNTTVLTEDPFSQYEQKLLLLSLTYRLCSINNRKIVANLETFGHRNEVFLRLIQHIERFYMEERGVQFYADKLCLSANYLSALCKTICGYTVQKLVFKSIIRKSISLLKNSEKNVQEISDILNFPNASQFGTFFKKQTGFSPQQYRNNIEI